MQSLHFRKAVIDDLEAILQMLADDQLGASREEFTIPLPSYYLLAFARINADPAQALMVAEMGHEIVATFQLTYIPYLTHKGSYRAQVEAVRVHKDFRSKGIGRQVFNFIIEDARKKGCAILQLTTNKQRSRARDFYESLGFEASHEGMKMML